MAELKQHAHVEQINQLDEKFQSEQHLDSKEHLKRVANAAKAEVNKVNPDGLTDWFAPDNADAAVSAPLRLDVWNSTAKSKSLDIMRSTRTQVLAVLENAGVSFENSLSDEAYAPNLERLAWQDAKYDTLDMIENTHQLGLSSYAVASGYETFLVEAKNKTDKEWNKQKKENQEAIDKMGWWRRNVYYWKDPSKEVIKFNTEVEAQIAEMYAGLESQTKKVKENAKDRVDNMAERVEAIWESTIDPDEKEELWEEIKDTAGASNLSTLSLSAFGITDDQDKIDFAEALMRLDFVKQGLGLSQASEHKHNQQEGLLKDASEIEAAIRPFDYGRYETFATSLEASGIKAQENVKVSTSDLVKILIDELSAQAKPIESWFNAIPGANLNTDSSRLAVLMQNMAVTDFQSFEAKQAYLNWYAGMDNETSGGNAKYESANDVNEAYGNLSHLSQGPLGKIEKVLTKYKSLKVASNNPLDNLSKFTDFRNKVLEIATDARGKFNDFEEKKSEFAADDRQRLEQLWAKTNTILSKVAELSNTWRKEKLEYEDWKKLLREKEDDRDSAEKDLNRVVSAGLHKDTIKVHSNQYEARKSELESVKANKTTQTEFDDLHIQLADLAALTNTTRLHRNVTPNSAPAGTFEDRIRSRIMKDFTKEIEASLLQRMEQNDQFDLLMQCNEGSIVEIDHKIVAGVQSLKFPQQLDSPVHGVFRVARKIEGQGVLLEDTTSSATITILGPTVKGGEPYKNAIVANAAGGAGGTTTSAGGANAIITNMQIL